MLRFSDLQLMVGGGTIDNEEDVEHNAFSFLIQPSPELFNRLTLMMTDGNCLYLFNQLVYRTVASSNQLYSKHQMIMKMQQILVNYFRNIFSI